MALIASLGVLLLVATMTGLVASPAAAATRQATYERGLVSQVNALRARHGLDGLRPHARLALCHQRVATRAAVRMSRTGRLHADSITRLASCPTVLLKATSVKAKTSPAASRALLRRPAVRKALLSPRARTVSIGTRRNARGTWSTVVVVGGPRKATAASEPAPSTATEIDPASEAGLMRTAVYTDTNAARGSEGLAPLATHACLEANAQRWAETLAAQGALAHQDLPSIWDECGTSSRLGENVAYRWDPDGAEMVVQWMASAGHRANILNGSFTQLGVGVAQGEDGRWYGVQVFSGDLS